MSTATEEPGAGHNFNKALSNDVAGGAKMIEALKAERQATNAKINEIRLEMEGKGIPRQAFDQALRIASWDEEKMQAFDYAYIFCRAAIEQPVEPDLFSATNLEEISLKDKLDEANAKIEQLQVALADETLASKRLLAMHTNVVNMTAPEYLEYEDAGARYARQVEEQKRVAQAAIDGKEYEPPAAPEAPVADVDEDREAAADDGLDDYVAEDATAVQGGPVETQTDAPETEETPDEKQAREIAEIKGDDYHVEDDGRPKAEHWDSEDDRAEQEQWDAADTARQGNAVDVEDSEEIDVDTAAEDEHGQA